VGFRFDRAQTGVRAASVRNDQDLMERNSARHGSWDQMQVMSTLVVPTVRRRAVVDSLILGIFAVSAGINVSVAGASVEAIGNLLLSKAAAGHRGLGTDRP
jgi:hypothetical protein